MITAAIIIGIILIFLVFLIDHVKSCGDGEFNDGMALGVVITIIIIIESLIIHNIIAGPTPTAMDVYQGKTTLKYEIVDDVKVDSVVTFKNDTTGLNIY